MDAELAAKYATLKSNIEDLGRVIVAFSGGVDSSLVAYVAAETLGDDALAVTSGSKSLKRSDLKLAGELADKWGMRHRIIVTDEVMKPEYRANPVNRCFHCKTSLYEALEQIAADEGYDHVLNGTNTDDLGDHRPGLIAARNYEVASPLVDAGFAKRDIRALATALGMENARKPQAACLSSRFPYGSHITEARLAQVEAAEDALAELGFSQFRVRHHEDVARIEIVAEELPRALELREAIQDRVKAAGYRFVAVDLGGFRSGSLNEGLIDAVQLSP
ncbi:MAG: ATP-dependent sacrificial sulfur transferase LarE [Gammaproteobacteria bacterium]|nr:ATP-dependent sacrificial sulfur transferase LarE [Gammaproteobacteria bacterium]MYF28863.1 ATP-dependent sacrificial sulfur transferase LarE [Gammaproteobacteria bacterium]MYK48051.1 ATP-dependent sacrificial sulfur transferase LarE [Gammaproteobacteria bacterium]